MASLNETQNLSNVEQKKEYHKLLDKLSLLDTDSVDNKTRVDETMQVLNDAKSLVDNVTTASTSVALLDSYVLLQAGRQALHAASSIQANTNVYNADELAQHVRENPAFWAFLLPRQVPSSAYLHGAFESAPPPARARAPRVRAPRARSAALAKPDNIATLEKTQEDTVMVTRVWRHVRRACERDGALSYFHCVLDPGSFARSVHNIYYVSFLVRDGKLAVYVDQERGIPMVRPAARADCEQRDISQENQFIVSIDVERWQKLIEAFDIKEPLIRACEH